MSIRFLLRFLAVILIFSGIENALSGQTMNNSGSGQNVNELSSKYRFNSDIDDVV
jgi:hypothetical protein